MERTKTGESLIIPGLEMGRSGQQVAEIREAPKGSGKLERSLSRPVDPSHWLRLMAVTDVPLRAPEGLSG
jgi:hypothetical protein